MGEYILYKTEFSHEGKTYELVGFTAEQLGLPNRATTAEIIGTKDDLDENGNPAPFTSGAMTKLDLELCPAEVGPHLRLRYSGAERMSIAMEPIIDRSGDLFVFHLRRWYDERLTLYVDVAKPTDRWGLDSRVVFRLRKPA